MYMHMHTHLCTFLKQLRSDDTHTGGGDEKNAQVMKRMHR